MSLCPCQSVVWQSAASTTPGGQPLAASFSCCQLLHRLSSPFKAWSSSGFPQQLVSGCFRIYLTLLRPLNNLFITCSPVTSLRVPSASCQDRETKTLTGKSWEFWVQFSSVQFNSANIYRARSSELGSVPVAGDTQSDLDAESAYRESTA